MTNDPDCLVNLIDSADHAIELESLRLRLEMWMVTTNDPMLEVFRNRSDPAAREAFVAAEEAAAEARKRGKR